MKVGVALYSEHISIREMELKDTLLNLPGSMTGCGCGYLGRDGNHLSNSMTIMF